MMKQLLIPAFCFLFITHSFAQAPKKLEATQDTNYIKLLAAKWSFRLHAITKYNQFIYSGPGFAASYKPDVKIAFGIGASYKNLALDLGLNLISTDPEHKSKNLALLSSMYFGPHVMEITAQLYQHYSDDVSDKNEELLSDQFRPDIHTINLGLNYNYNFNHRKFSFDAASIGTQIQKRSAGTPLAGAFLTYFNLDADSTIIASEFANPDAMIAKANLFSGGISAGYAYIFVLPAHLYVMLSLTPKLALNAGNAETNTNHAIPVNISPGLLTRDAIGYSGNRFYGFISLLADYNSLKTEEGNHFSYDPVKLKMLLGYRFN